jgi:fatty acid desaturase
VLRGKTAATLLAIDCFSLSLRKMIQEVESVKPLSFETVDKTTLTNSGGVSYLDFRSGLRPRYGVLWAHLLFGYAVLVATVIASVYLQKAVASFFWLTIPVAALLIGYTVSALHLFLHEASHYHFAADKRMNEWLSNISVGILVGMEVNFYRSVHFAHHRLIGTKKDTEKSYFHSLGWSFLLESLTGIKLLKVILHRHENIKLNYGSDAGEAIIRKNNLMFAVAVVVNTALVVTLFITGYWQAALSWIIGMGIMFPFFAMFRQMLEHRTPGASADIDYNQVDQGASHRMFGDGIIASTLGAAGFNRHLIHHWDPQISYTRLKDVEEYLMDTPLKAELAASQTTYLQTFLLLFNK